MYLWMSPAVEVVDKKEQQWGGNLLKLPSRGFILTLTALFSVDHFAQTLLAQSLVAFYFATQFGI